MALEPNGSDPASSRARTSTPTLRELLGDFEAFPVFRDMAVVCEEATASRRLAWPMPLPFPSVPPARPEFESLDALYCNHLGHLLLHASGARDADALPGGYPGLLAFFVHAADCHAHVLPAEEAGHHAERVAALLGRSMRLTRLDDAFWRAAHVQAQARGAAWPAGVTGETQEALLRLPAHGAKREDVSATLLWLYTRFEAATRA